MDLLLSLLYPSLCISLSKEIVKLIFFFTISQNMWCKFEALPGEMNKAWASIEPIAQSNLKVQYFPAIEKKSFVL